MALESVEAECLRECARGVHRVRRSSRLSLKTIIPSSNPTATSFVSCYSKNNVCSSAYFVFSRSCPRNGNVGGIWRKTRSYVCVSRVRGCFQATFRKVAPDFDIFVVDSRNHFERRLGKDEAHQVWMHEWRGFTTRSAAF
jgi:hypothetical protein